MPVSFEKLLIGAEYDRPYLAEKWGYSGYQALAKGIVTPSHTPYIILFVTEEKQAFQTQYKDCLINNILKMDGETSHTADQRITHAESAGDEIHLFHRLRHHSPFIYYGKVHLINYKLNATKPSRFIFSICDKPNVIDEFDHSFARRQSSYKMVTILALLSAGSDCGYVAIDNLAVRFAAFYQERFKRGLIVEKSGITLSKFDGIDLKIIRQVMLSNPVVHLGEFLDLDRKMGTLAFRDHVWSSLDDELIGLLHRIAFTHLREYYKDLDGLDFTEIELINFFKEVSDQAQDHILYNTIPYSKKNDLVEALSTANEKSALPHTLLSFLKDYEVITELTGLQFIGQYELTEEDIDRIGEHIYTHLKMDSTEGFNKIKLEAPEALALYLVGKGVYSYDDGDYWTAVAENIGLPDISWQDRFGRWFVDYLESMGKKLLEIPEAHKYVANILLHGGIPQSCLPAFFGEVIQTITDEGLNDMEVIRIKLNDWRYQEGCYFELNQQINEHQKQHDIIVLKKIQAKKLAAMKKDHLHLENKIFHNSSVWEQLDEDFEINQQKRIADMKALTAEEQKLRHLVMECQNTLDICRVKYEKLIDSMPIIQAFVEQYSRNKDMIDLAAKLKKEESECLNNVFGLLGKAEHVMSANLKTNISKLPIDKTSNLLKQHLELEALDTKQKDDLNMIEDKVLKPSISLWLGLFLFTGGLILTVINPIEVLYWFPAIIGALISLNSWLSYKKYKGRIMQERRNTLVLSESEIDKSKISSSLTEIEEVSEGLLSVNLLSELSVIEKLAATFTTLSDVKYKRAAIEEEINRLFLKAEEIKKVCLELELEEVVTTDETDPAIIDNCFKSAVDVVSMFIKEQLELAEIQEKVDSIEHDISLSIVEQKAIHALVDEMNDILSSIGDGDIECGASLVKTYFNNNALITHLENELSKPELSFNKLEPIKLEPDDLEKFINRLEEVEESNGKRICNFQQQLSGLERLLIFLDEPIRRFLLYGEEWAEAWMLETTQMYLKAKAGSSYVVKEGSILPARVIDAFNKWWDDAARSKPQPGGNQTSLRQRLLTPTVRLHMSGELTLIFPPQRFYHSDVGSTHGVLSVFAVEGELKISEANLPLYLRSADMLETDLLQISLFDLPNALTIRFFVGESLIQEWVVKLMIQYNLPMAIFDDNGLLIESMPIKREKLWFLMHDELMFDGDLTPLEEGLICLNGDYHLYLVNLDAVEGNQLYIIDSHGQTISLALSGEERVAPCIVGSKVDGVEVNNGNILYLKENLSIHIPAVEQSELKAWAISLKPTAGYLGEGIHCKLEQYEDLIQYKQDISMLVLPLDAMFFSAEELCGSYIVNLVFAANRDYQFDLNFVDDLEFIFNPLLSPPSSNEEMPINLKIRHTKGLGIDIFEPAELQSVAEDNMALTVNTSTDHLHGFLKWADADGNALEIKLIATIPKVRWRVHGLSEIKPTAWHDNTEELWFGDWQKAKELQIYISLPEYIKGRARLRLNDSRHYYEEEIKRGLVKFNLLPFADSVKSGNDLASFKLDIYDRNRTEYLMNETLFKVRTKWIISELDLKQEISGNMARLNINWKEHGKLDGNLRIMRLWDKGQPFAAPVFEIKIPEGKTNVITEMPMNLIPSGYYLLEFDIVEPWSATESETVFPHKLENSFSCEIFGDRVVIQDYRVDWLSGDAVVQGTVRNSEVGLPVEVYLYGCDRGHWVCWFADTTVDKDGFFKVVLPAQKLYAHWIGIRAQSDPPAYLYSLLPDPSGLLFPWDQELIELLLSFGSELAEVRIFDLSDSDLEFPLSSVIVSDIVKILDGNENELLLWLKYSDSTSKKAKMLVDLDKKVFRIELEQGVRCTGQGCKNRGHYEIFPDQAAWFEHSSRLISPECKGMETNYRSTDVQLVIAWDVKPYLSKLKILFPLLGDVKLYGTIGSQLSHLNDFNRHDVNIVGAKLLKQEITVIDKYIKGGLIDQRRVHSIEH